MLSPNIDYSKTSLPLGTSKAELNEWRRARAGMVQPTMNESRLIAPTINFTDPVPFPAKTTTIMPTPNYAGRGTHNVTPLGLPTMNFDGRDIGSVVAPPCWPMPTHQQVQNNVTGGRPGGDVVEPLGLPSSM